MKIGGDASSREAAVERAHEAIGEAAAGQCYA